MADPSETSGGKFVNITFNQASQKTFWGIVDSPSPPPKAPLNINGSGLTIPAIRFETSADGEVSIAYARGSDQWGWRVEGSRLRLTISGTDVLSLGATPVDVIGSKGAGTALISLLGALVTLGLITDSTTA